MQYEVNEVSPLNYIIAAIVIVIVGLIPVILSFILHSRKKFIIFLVDLVQFIVLAYALLFSRMDLLVCVIVSILCIIVWIADIVAAIMCRRKK